METKTQHEERMAAKMAAAKWPEGLERPTKRPRLKLTGTDGNAFSIIGNAQRAARAAGWSEEQIAAFRKLATSGNYDNVLCTCMDFFEVR